MTYDPETEYKYDDDDEAHGGWHGLITFAVCVLVLVGVFHVIGGFVALFEDDVYAVDSSDLVVTVDYNGGGSRTWRWAWAWSWPRPRCSGARPGDASSPSRS